MDAAQKLLTLSVHQDLLELNRICKKISSCIEKDEVQSWLFPSKFSLDVTEFEIGRDAKDSAYVSCLEKLVDRIHYLINLMSKYTNAKYTHKHEEIKSFKAASTLTLGTAASLVWENVQIIPTVIRIEENSMENSSNSKQTQTEEFSRNRCDSCGFAVLCIKSLYRKVQNVVKELNTEAESKPKIGDITQAGYMNKITGIIENAFDKVFSDYTNTKSKCATLETKLNDTQNLLAKANDELNELKPLKEQLDENLQKLKSDYEDVVQAKNHFHHNILRKKKLLDELTEQHNNLKQEHEICSRENDNLKATIFLASSEKDFLKKRFEDLRAEEESLKLQSEHVRIKMWNAENEIDNCKVLLENVENKIEKNIENFETTSDIYEELHNKIEQIYVQISKNKNETLSELLNSNQNNEVAGDPVKDMRREINHNNGVIEKLSERNKKLLTVVTRLQNLKSSQE